MGNDGKFFKGDIVEDRMTGQTFRVVSNVDGKLSVKGNGLTKVLLLSEVTKAPDRPAREESRVAKK